MFHASRPSRHVAVPADVTDLLLWRLAVDVADAHHPDSDGRCQNLQCTAAAPGPCPAAVTARRAHHAARLPRTADGLAPATAHGRDRVVAVARGVAPAVLPHRRPDASLATPRVAA